MLKEKDKIFTNLFGDETYSLKSAQKRGDWNNTKSIIKKGRDWIIDEMKKSELRGRGGAGFPTGLKWSFMPKDPALNNYLVVNADESEPGTCKDRDMIRNEPHKLIEGCLLASFAMNAHTCYIYIRGEYFNEAVVLQNAIDEAYEAGLVGKNAAKSGWDFDIYLHRGAGAYICGEESAMIESIEGKRGMPRLRPPFVAQVGLFGRPTLAHNMETLYWVRDILQKGADWFTSHGRNGRKGLRSFSVSGRVKNPGVYLAPAGITVSELIDEYAGGMLEGHEFYGYFPGGASGGILPASLSEIPLDFDTLHDYGCFIGSAAIIILSDKDTAVSAASNTMKFFLHESCGKCTPCRVGTSKAVSLMSEKKWNVPLLHDLSQVMSDASICGLGQAASNPLKCVLKYFPEEVNDDCKT